MRKPRHARRFDRTPGAARAPGAAVRALGAAALALGLARCGAQADSDYLGEPLVSLNGQVISSGALPPLQAAMLWQTGAPPSTDDIELATLAPVTAGFPASFTVRLYQPAPAEARQQLAPGEPMYARANAAAVPYGIAQAQLGALPASGSPSYGLDATHWVMFLASDVPAGSITEWWLGAAFSEGFHLVDATPFNPACVSQEALDACVAELVSRGAPDDGTDNPGTARGFCTADYRLAPSAPGTGLVLNLGEVGVGGTGSCP